LSEKEDEKSDFSGWLNIFYYIVQLNFY
jgi:hypothetical protein